MLNQVCMFQSLLYKLCLPTFMSVVHTVFVLKTNVAVTSCPLVVDEKKLLKFPKKAIGPWIRHALLYLLCSLILLE